MVTVCPAFFRAAAACSCVALDKSTPFTYEDTHNMTHHEMDQYEYMSASLMVTTTWVHQTRFTIYGT